MQWRRQRKVIHVIGSSKHVLLLARYQDAPPGEEDEEEGLRNGYTKRQENDTHGFSGKFGQSGYNALRAGSSNGGAYAGATTRHRDYSSGSTSQPKIIFNEDEYTRITTPRQDMLFKKGYLSKKKPWAGNANTSATSSTTESQSASHSTADGSETTEDQQLLDRDYGTGEYAPMIDSNTQLGYGPFYDHAGGYYYEYPVMLVGPAPMSAQAAPSVLAAMPCAPVPLRPIEWVNSTIVPKLPGEPYCMMNYESNQCMVENTVVVEEQEDTVLPMESTSRMWNENGTRCFNLGSVGEEMDDEQSIHFINAKEEERQIDEQEEEKLEEQYANEHEAGEQPLENGMNGGAYFNPIMMQDPVHVSHVIPAVPQPYMYPGHYMFGPPLINVNGVTIQSGVMIRTTDFSTMSAAMSAAYAKRKKKKKKKRQRRFVTGNTEDEEEGEYSSECDTGLPSSEPSWTATCSTTVTTTTTTATTTATTTTTTITASTWTLNPDCEEFQLRSSFEPRTPLPDVSTSANNTPTFETGSTINQPSTLSSDANLIDNESNAVCNGVISDDSKNQNDELSDNGKSDQQLEPTSTSLENGRSKSLDTFTSSDNESNRLTNCLPGDEEAAPSTDEVVSEATDVDKLPGITEAANNDCPSANELCERPSNEMNGEILTNGNLDSDSSSKNASMTTSRPSSPPVFNDENAKSGSITPKSVENSAIREDQNQESLSSSKSSSSTSLSKRKYNAKGSKFVREATPGPDLNSATEPENETKIHDLTQNLQKIDLSNDTKLSFEDSKFESHDNKTTKVDQVQIKLGTKTTVCDLLNKQAIEATNEDSGFESQTQLSDYPITQAVTEWLRREKSPDLFIASAISMDCEEDEDDMDQEPSKNLQSNPILALSASSGADNTALSRAAICGEFAGLGNIKSGQEQQQPDGSSNSGASRRKKDAKRRSEERRRVARHVVNGKVDHEVVSSSDSCDQKNDLTNITRRKNLAKQQQQDVVDDICEFTEKDSVAGVRVASSSRIDSKRVNARRTKRQGKSHARNPSNNIDTNIRRTGDVDGEDDDGIVEDTMNVRTFEKGEIIVSEDGKLLTSSTYEPDLRKCHDAATTIKAPSKSKTGKETTERKLEEERKRSSSVEDEKSGSGIDSLDSIEEPDVLECWETEIIEPVVTPKRMLQSEGIVCEGEAAEDDTIEVEQVNVDYVQKYYRLARESATSIEEISLKADPPTSSKSVPNMSERKEEIPAKKEPVKDKDDMPIDEAFEVYESCYTGNSPFLAMDSKVFKLRTLYGQEGETPIPCKTVCCQIQ
ncbi:serine-rich adhesin for platelets-like isoform X2 [Bombus pascuorum]|uniref:serine-rich adhesin for platelets-like isoform X2 n=1 Tax=Bombus pascuorum TaxID=65598 RepID=UPI00213A38A3|nr:serine-rich adhesin for platelets-like isoform X2 [Bombus pascuorum]